MNEEGQEKHWTEEFAHEKLATPEALTEAKTALSKYDTINDAVVGGLEAQKMVGKKTSDFLASDEGGKVLDSMGVIRKPGKDAKPEDVHAFQKMLLKELGAVDKEDDLKDLNLTVGLPEGTKPDEVLAGVFKKWSVQEEIPKPIAQKILALHNTLQVAAAQQAKEKQLEQIEVSTKEYIKHYKTDAEFQRRSELFKRAIGNHAKLSGEQYEQVGDDIAKSGIMIAYPMLYETIVDLISPISEEAATKTGEGGKPEPKVETKEEITVKKLPGFAKDLGW